MKALPKITRDKLQSHEKPTKQPVVSLTLPSAASGPEVGIAPTLGNATLLSLKVATIVVPTERRACDPDKVAQIAASIEAVGQLQPIIVRRADDKVQLIDGLYRVEAIRKNGRDCIDAMVHGADEVDARILQLVANVSRVDMTVLEKAEDLGQCLRFVKDRQVLPVATPGGKQPAEKGIRRLACETGLDPSTVSRLIKIDGISPEAKKAIRAAALDNNRSVLAEVAREDVSKQLAKVQEILDRTARLLAPTPADDNQTDQGLAAQPDAGEPADSARPETESSAEASLPAESSATANPITQTPAAQSATVEPNSATPPTPSDLPSIDPSRSPSLQADMSEGVDEPSVRRDSDLGSIVGPTSNTAALIATWKNDGVLRQRDWDAASRAERQQFLRTCLVIELPEGTSV